MSFDMAFDVATQTANGRVNPSILEQEIIDSGITTGLPIEGTATEGGSVSGTGQVTGGTVTIMFTAAPSGADQAVVTATVLAHQGDAFGPPVQRISDESVSSTTNTSPQVKVGATTLPVPAGTFLLFWYCEIRVQAIVANSGVRATIVANSGTEIGQDNWDSDQWGAFSGSFSAVLEAGDTPTVQIRFARLGALNTVEIRRARLTISQEDS